MLTRKHVLVLGAGASSPFGFPTGFQLAEMVANQLLEGNDTYNKLTEIGISAQTLLDFRSAFFRSGKNSVDAFLEHRTDLMEIGKLVTAALLIPYEHDNNLFTYKDNWLRQLYGSLNTTFEKYADHELAIVTFNYDRTVEHFLFTSLKNSYKKSDEECARIVSKIPIIHLHGTLGPLPWQSRDHSRSFSNKLTEETVRLAASNIKIIHEDITDGRDKEFERAKQYLQNAERVLFMGFGYNKTNMDRLAISALRERVDTGQRVVLGTCVGMSGHQRNVARSESGQVVSMANQDCLGMIQDNLIF